MLASNRIYIQKSLVFFNDAEPDETPRMLKEAVWKDIKKYFEDSIRG